MKQVLLSVAAVALSLALVGAAEAAPRGGHSPGGMRKGNSRGYHLTHGTKFQGGYFYKGREHRHWTYRYWWAKYGCYTYWCPSTSCWYYYYPKEECYYPVSHITTAAPVAAPAPAGVPTGVTQVVNVTNGSPGSATATAGAAGAPAPPDAGAASKMPSPPEP